MVTLGVIRWDCWMIMTDSSDVIIYSGAYADNSLLISTIIDGKIGAK